MPRLLTATPSLTSNQVYKCQAGGGRSDFREPVECGQSILSDGERVSGPHCEGQGCVVG